MEGGAGGEFLGKREGLDSHCILVCTYVFLCMYVCVHEAFIQLHIR